MFTIDHNFQTPPPVCEYMVGMIPDNAVRILEPTPGLGNIVAALKAKDKYQITTPGDFFLLDKTSRYDCIVMNPPFSSKYAFMDNAPKESKAKGMRLGYLIQIVRNILILKINTRGLITTY